jgi:hypothetical protein
MISVTASVIQIDSTLSLVRINPELADVPLEQNSQDRILVAIIDSSGSMGGNVKTCHQSVGKMARKLGYSEVTVITFDTNVCTKQYTTADLEKSTRNCNGSTRISGTVVEVEKIIKSVENHLIQMIIISDGEVDDSDKPIFMREVSSLAERLQTSNTIHVIGCRLKTNTYGSADTQALSGFFNIHNLSGIIPDVLEWLDPNQIDTYMNQVYRTFDSNKSVLNYRLMTVTDQQVLRLKPWNPRSARISLGRGENTFLVETGDGIPLMKVNGCPVIFQQGVLESEDELASFITEVEFKVKNLKVMGCQNTNVEGIVMFIEKLQKYFDKQNMSDPAALNFSLRARSKLLFKNMQRQEKSRLQGIRELGNAEKVDKLNAAQQADFLRNGDPNSRAVRRLAGRVTLTGEINLNSEICKSLQILRDGDIKISEEIQSKLPNSFYGLYNDCEVIETVKETFDEISQLQSDQVLQVIGQVGTAYSADIGPIPDPWQYRVKQVFPRVFLSQNDLWESHSQSGGKSLSPPGQPDCVITGVDVIMTPGSEELYNLFRQTVFPRLHASASMRRMIAPVPYDTFGLKTAVTIRLIDQIFQGDLSSGTLETLVLEIKNLKYLDQQVSGTFGDLPKDILIQGTNLGAYLTGRQDITSLNKIICFLLSRYDTLPENYDFANLGRLMLSLDNYYHTRQKQISDREIVIETLLGFNLENKTGTGADFEQPPQPIVHYDKYDRNTLFAGIHEYQTNHWNTTAIIILITILRKNELDPILIGKMIREYNMTDDGIREVYKIEGDIREFFAANALQAISCKELADRVDTDKMSMKLKSISTTIERDNYFRSIISDKFKRIFEDEMKNKTIREQAIILERSISRMVLADNMIEYIQCLNEQIPQRDSPGFKRLIERLKGPEVVSMRDQKLWILVTGSRMWTGEIVWNNGNALRSGFNKLQKFFTENDWIELLRVARAQSFWVYRDSDKPNRHGHCTSNPSWFAYGYDSHDEMNRDPDLQYVKEKYYAYIRQIK